MKALLFFLFLPLTLWAQQKERLFLKSFDAEKCHEIEIHSSHGKIYLQPTADQVGARVQLIFPDEIDKQAMKVMESIAVIDSVVDNKVKLITKFDESLFLKSSDFFAIKDKINIEYRVKVPAHARVTIHQKHGSVFTGRIENPISVELSNAGLISKFTKNLVVSGSDFTVDASAIENLGITGSHGWIILAHIATCTLNLAHSTVESIGFKNLIANLNQSVMSAGRTDNVELVADKSTIEFTEIEDEASCQLSDVRIVIQKMPEQIILNTNKGKSTLGLHKERHSRLNLFAQNSETELKLKRGTFKASYVKKKTLVTLPEKGIVKRESAELIQQASHGLVLQAELKRGILTVSNN